MPSRFVPHQDFSPVGAGASLHLPLAICPLPPITLLNAQSEFNEIRHRQLFGALQKKRFLQNIGLGVEKRLERIAQHLAPLPEGLFDHLSEQRLPARKCLLRLAQHSYDARLHLRRRGKTTFVHTKQILPLVIGLQEHADDAVILVAGAGHNPHRHLPLKHAHHFRDDRPEIEHSEKNLRGDVVRKIADERKGLTFEYCSEVQLQKVGGDDAQAGICRKVSFQIRHHITVGFHRGEVATGSSEQLGEHAFSGAYFQYALIGQRQAQCDSAGNVFFVEKVLAK